MDQASSSGSGWGREMGEMGAMQKLEHQPSIFLHTQVRWNLETAIGTLIVVRLSASARAVSARGLQVPLGLVDVEVFGSPAPRNFFYESQQLAGVSTPVLVHPSRWMYRTRNCSKTDTNHVLAHPVANRLPLMGSTAVQPSAPYDSDDDDGGYSDDELPPPVVPAPIITEDMESVVHVAPTKECVNKAESSSSAAPEGRAVVDGRALLFCPHHEALSPLAVPAPVVTEGMDSVVDVAAVREKRLDDDGVKSSLSAAPQPDAPPLATPAVSEVADDMPPIVDVVEKEEKMDADGAEPAPSAAPLKVQWNEVLREAKTKGKKALVTTKCKVKKNSVVPVAQGSLVGSMMMSAAGAANPTPVSVSALAPASTPVTSTAAAAGGGTPSFSTHMSALAPALTPATSAVTAGGATPPSSTHMSVPAPASTPATSMAAAAGGAVPPPVELEFPANMCCGLQIRWHI
ncbi:hypothetical protein B0H19DRAFT_1246467 [Mycena capillaripes]|nr:hypothetical protein B0H19DRAFT_1246467 [Mycena capillaripes]